ncbi:MAG: radical SAM protein [Chloroflexi bacterium]|nr:radical SAM protein [Chloroflexota bacterium]
MAQAVALAEQEFSYVQDQSRHGDINEYLADILGEPFREYRRRWDQAHRLEVETEFPLYLSLETQLRCNFRCTMCTYSVPEEVRRLRYPERMSDALFDKIMEEASRHYCPSIGFNVLNEPLLDPKIIERIRKAVDAGFIDLRMNTNASLLTEEKAEQLVDSGLTRLYVGLDAVTPETYERVRIGGDYDAVMRNVLRFLEIREKKGKRLPILRVSFVRLAVNEHEIPQFIAYWFDKADMVTIQEYMPPVINEDFLAKHAKSKRIPRSYTCPQPFERLVIKGNGDMHPCCAQYNYKIRLGNLRDMSIYEAWHSDTMRTLRRHMKERTWEALPVCNVCLKSSYLYQAA